MRRVAAACGVEVRRRRCCAACGVNVEMSFYEEHVIKSMLDMLESLNFLVYT